MNRPYKTDFIKEVIPWYINIKIEHGMIVVRDAKGAINASTEAPSVSYEIKQAAIDMMVHVDRRRLEVGINAWNESREQFFSLMWK